MGWLFEHSGTTEHERYARDLYEDRGMQLIHKTFPLWVALGIAIPAGARLRHHRHRRAARSRRRCGAGRCGSSSATT